MLATQASGRTAREADRRRTSLRTRAMMNITQAASGIHVVVETDKTILIGPFAARRGDTESMQDAATDPVIASQAAEDYIRQTARYGVEVEHREIEFDAIGIRRVRKLGDVPKA